VYVGWSLSDLNVAYLILELTRKPGLKHRHLYFGRS